MIKGSHKKISMEDYWAEIEFEKSREKFLNENHPVLVIDKLEVSNFEKNYLKELNKKHLKSYGNYNRYNKPIQ